MSDKRSYIKHTDHPHPNTREARRRCRIQMLEGGGPLDGKALSREARRDRAAREQQESIDTMLKMTEHRDSSGRFMHPTLDEWKSLIENLENASEWLTMNATLEQASLTLTIGGRNLVATFTPEVGWSVGTSDN